MSEIEVSKSKIYKYEFELQIASTVKHVWELITYRLDDWWVTDFRALGAGSTMSLSLTPGGQLVERAENGAVLEWYRVQMVVPESDIYLVGYLAPDWGGPTISMLKLALQDKDGVCQLTVSDALFGNVNDEKVARLQSGWQSMFGEGLKRFAEQ